MQWRDLRKRNFPRGLIQLQGEELDRYKEIFFAKNPDARQWEDLVPDLAFFKIIPQWIRFTGFKQEPWEVTFPEE